MSVASPSPILPAATLDRGVRLLGHAHALDNLFTHLDAGKPLTLGVLGASVGQNAGCLDQPGKRCMSYRGVRGTPTGFAIRLLRHINRTWPNAGHRIENSALDGTGVAHSAKCIVSHLPPTVNLVIAEWGSMAMHTVWALPSIERATRILLSRASPPVLVHLSIHEWCSQRIGPPRSLYRVGDVLKGSLRNWVYPDTPWAAVDDESTRISRHYGQASVSVHAALAPHVLSNEKNFDLLDITGIDCLHPVNGRLGIEYVEQLLNHWLDKAYTFWHRARTENRYLLTARQSLPGSAAAVSGDRHGHGHRHEPNPLPPPLHQENAQERMATRCYAFTHETGTMAAQLIMAKADWCSRTRSDRESTDAGVVARLQGATTSAHGREALQDPACWKAKHQICPAKIRETQTTGRNSARAKESRAAYSEFMAHPPRHWFFCGVSLGEAKRKISAGVVAMVPGAELRARVQGWGSRYGQAEGEVNIEHLTSYTGMGMARVQCLGGCSCAPQVMDAHKTNELRNVSVFEPHTFTARAVSVGRDPGPCEILITVLQRTNSGGHKLKIRTVTVTTSLAVAASG